MQFPVTKWSFYSHQSCHIRVALHFCLSPFLSVSTFQPRPLSSYSTGWESVGVLSLPCWELALDWLAVRLVVRSLVLWAGRWIWVGLGTCTRRGGIAHTEADVKPVDCQLWTTKLLAYCLLLIASQQLLFLPSKKGLGLLALPRCPFWPYNGLNYHIKNSVVISRTVFEGGVDAICQDWLWEWEQ